VPGELRGNAIWAAAGAGGLAKIIPGVDIARWYVKDLMIVNVSPAALDANVQQHCQIQCASSAAVGGVHIVLYCTSGPQACPCAHLRFDQLGDAANCHRGLCQAWRDAHDRRRALCRRRVDRCAACTFPPVSGRFGKICCEAEAYEKYVTFSSNTNNSRHCLS